MENKVISNLTVSRDESKVIENALKLGKKGTNNIFKYLFVDNKKLYTTNGQFAIRIKDIDLANGIYEPIGKPTTTKDYANYNLVLVEDNEYPDMKVYFETDVEPAIDYIIGNIIGIARTSLSIRLFELTGQSYSMDLLDILLMVYKGINAEIKVATNKGKPLQLDIGNVTLLASHFNGYKR